MKHYSRYVFPICVMAVLFLGSCAQQRKISTLRVENVLPTLQLPPDRNYIPEVKDVAIRQRDTLKVTDLDGKELLVMRAVWDEETKDMVATEQLEAARITARFRNIAERNGKIDLEFQVIVPEKMQDTHWQLRFYPDMYILGDSLRLDDVVITGSQYRRAQLRGYEQYERWLKKIITDTTKFLDLRNLNIFIARNIPQIYAFRTDTTYVTDEEFYSYFGVSEQEAIEHYKRTYLIKRNERLKKMRAKKWQKYIKVPIVDEGIKLDTVIQGYNGDLVYNYVQTINTRKGLRKVDVILSGEIYDMDKPIYTMNRTEPLTFYVSSVSAFVSDQERYLSKVISRKASANVTANIEFRSGRDNVDEGLNGNRDEIGYIKKNLVSLLQNDTFELDSITIVSSASPEGSEGSNKSLSTRRAKSSSTYFEKYVEYVIDSLKREEGMMITVGENNAESGMTSARKSYPKIRFYSRSGGENWTLLDELVDRDTLMTDADKAAYYDLRASVKDNDVREKRMAQASYYKHLFNDVYPKLRTSRFDFALHRRDMVKDTVHTTELDTVYMRGVQLLRDHEYEAALAILRPYQDYNTAVAYVALDYNASAMEILKNEEKTAQVNYMLALLYSRKGDDEKAVQHYLNSCQQEQSYVYRGNLDPEISVLIKRYNLNADDGDDFGDLVY